MFIVFKMCGLFSFFSSTNVETKHVCPIAYNEFALGAVADFGARNCQTTTKADARHTLKLTTKPAIEPNACYALFFLRWQSMS